MARADCFYSLWVDQAQDLPGNRVRVVLTHPKDEDRTEEHVLVYKALAFVPPDDPLSPILTPQGALPLCPVRSFRLPRERARRPDETTLAGCKRRSLGMRRARADDSLVTVSMGHRGQKSRQRLPATCSHYGHLLRAMCLRGVQRMPTQVASTSVLACPVHSISPNTPERANVAMHQGPSSAVHSWTQTWGSSSYKRLIFFWG